MTSPRILNLVIGTAGHIDHGKSALVERLTGQHPDTLKEERERGLTINLGYATFELADGRKVGIIDVPGHERFIKNMVAGASGIQFVLFVIAADDSIMPQSREHLDILKLLGIHRGVVVLTKIDLVDEETAEIATEEIRDFVGGTFLEGAPVFPVSSTEGRGIEELRRHLDEVMAGVTSESRDLPFRLPVQRTFSASGYGTIVTGIPVSGRVRVGDSLEILPHGTISRVRGLEAYGQRIEEAAAGHRTALNLSDADYRTVVRGNVVAEPERYRASRYFEARLEYLRGNTKALKHRTPIRFLSGTMETVGRIALVDRPTLEPGESGFVQIFLQEGVAAAEGDRYIVRTISPMTTIGGGCLIGGARARLRRFRGWTLDHLRRKEAAIPGDPAEYLAEVLFGYGRTPVSAGELARDVHRAPGEVQRMLAGLEAEGKVVSLAGGKQPIHAAILDRMAEELIECIRGLYAVHPMSLFVPLRDIARKMKLDASLIETVATTLEERGRIRRGPQGRLGLPDHEPRLTPRQKELRGRVASVFRESFLAPPGRGEIGERVGAGKEESQRMADLLVEEGEIVRLKDDCLLHHEAIREAADRLREALRRDGPMTASAIRDLLGTSRKYLIPLLEHFDESGITVRDGDLRKLPEGGPIG
jgi:selenocysteine-specific elongation factor